MSEQERGNTLWQHSSVRVGVAMGVAGCNHGGVARFRRGLLAGVKRGESWDPPRVLAAGYVREIRL
jgi:hypothetical protein